VSDTAAAARRVKNMAGAGEPLKYPITTIAILEVKKVPAMTLGDRLVRRRSTNFRSVSTLILGDP
jgi:hypothetical protein